MAVLIDDENVGLGSVEWLFDQVSNLGRILIRRAYSDWSKGGNVRDQLLEFGIEPVHVFQASSSGKNASDIRLAIDAIDLLYSSPVDTFVIVSGDGDFLPLVNKLRSSGKMVIGAGRQKSTSATLVKACDRFYYLDKHEESGEESKPRPKERPRGSLLVRALRASMDADGKVTGSRLHATMQRLDPGFDFRDRSFNSFTAYLEASPEVKVDPSIGPGPRRRGHRVATKWAGRGHSKESIGRVQDRRGMVEACAIAGQVHARCGRGARSCKCARRFQAQRRQRRSTRI